MVRGLGGHVNHLRDSLHVCCLLACRHSSHGLAWAILAQGSHLVHSPPFGGRAPPVFTHPPLPVVSLAVFCKAGRLWGCTLRVYEDGRSLATGIPSLEFVRTAGRLRPAFPHSIFSGAAPGLQCARRAFRRRPPELVRSLGGLGRWFLFQATFPSPPLGGTVLPLSHAGQAHDA